MFESSLANFLPFFALYSCKVSLSRDNSAFVFAFSSSFSKASCLIFDNMLSTSSNLCIFCSNFDDNLVEDLGSDNIDFSGDNLRHSS
jgi:hypothetical protein